MNTYRVTYTDTNGDSFSEWYEARNERIAILMLGWELSDFMLSSVVDVTAEIETD